MTITLDRTRARALLPERPENGHKGTFGHVFVIGGSRGMTGAVVMASLAAARSGAGLVTAGIPRPLGDAVAAHLVVGMSYMLESTREETVAAKALGPALEFARDKDAVVLGPGMSRHAETREFVIEFVRQCASPLLVDADGLNCLSTDLSALDTTDIPIILTPHPGEMARLNNSTVGEVQKDREKTAFEFASRTGTVVVLKGQRTVISNGKDILVNTTGNSGMATGGTGDVLSGLIGGLLAQGMNATDAAALGVYTHGLAGDIAAGLLTGRALIATDLIECLPDAWAALERQAPE